MKIGKVINNNVVSAWDADGKEVVVMGKGIGFQKKAGEEITGKVEKIFRLESPDIRERFKNLLAGMPLVYIQVSDEIISYAKKVLDCELSQNVYLTLLDHIHFAIDRYEKGMFFENALYEEIKCFYPKEFEVGLQAVKLILEKTGIELPDHEAASIAVHLVNAEYNSSMHDTAQMTQMIRDLTRMAEEEIDFSGQNSFYKDRFVTNLKFLVQRMVLLEPIETADDWQLYEFLNNHCKREYALAEKMREYVKLRYLCDMQEREFYYLLLQLKMAGNMKDTAKK